MIALMSIVGVAGQPERGSPASSESSLVILTLAFAGWNTLPEKYQANSKDHLMIDRHVMDIGFQLQDRRCSCWGTTTWVK